MCPLLPSARFRLKRELLVVWLLRPDASAVAIGAVHSGQVSNVNRVLESLSWHRRDLCATFLLIHHRMAGVAVFADHLAVLAHVVTIVAAETALIVHVPDVIGMGLPIHLHVGKEGGAIDALQFNHRTLDAVRLGRRDLRVLVLVAVSYTH